MRRFLIDKPAETGMIYTIEGPDAKHIKNVLRMIPGDDIWLFNGTGSEFKACIRTIDATSIDVEIIETLSSASEPPIHITVGQAFLKDKKMDTLLRQLTEIGITQWQPVMAERSVPKLDSKKIKSRVARWQTIAKESLKQCERGWLPEILPPVSFDEILNIGNTFDLKIMFTDKNETPLNKSVLKNPSRILVMLGPEGGFTPHEIEKAQNNGFISAGLGPRILKADTASVAACAIIQHIIGDM